ncbi:MAG: hypothetical protein Q8936_23930, partial [Bacillota bacterium]|nr:hypothetical protein [Bacillota bacterium]
SIKLYALTNNNTLVSANVATTNVLTGSLKLQIFNTLVNEKGNAFAENFTLLDLNKLGRTNGFSDSEALSILKGIKHIKELTLLTNGDFSNGTTGWSTTASASVNATNNELTIVPIALYGGVTQTLPNPTSYKNHILYTKALLKTTSNQVILYINDGVSQSGLSATDFTQYQLVSVKRIIDSNATTCIVKIQDNRTSNWDSIYVKDIVCIDLTALFGAGNEPTQAQCDTWFSQGSNNLIGSYNTELFDITKVSLTANASLNNSVITLNATSGYQNNTLFIPVLPNNKYEFKVNKTGFNGYVDIRGLYNSVISQTITVGLGTSQADGQYTLTFITNNNINNIRIILTSTSSGTFTFSNISLKIRM